MKEKTKNYILVVTTTVDAFTGREKLELLLVTASNKVLATAVVDGVELVLLKIRLAFTTIPDPWL